MKKSRKMFISGAIFLLLCFVLLLVSGISIRKIKDAAPNCSYIYNSEGIGMTIGDMRDIKALSHMSAMYVLALSKTEQGVVSAERVNITYATPMDEGIVPMEFVRGGWFDDWMGEEKLAVIPESLAAYLAEESVDVNGEMYRVCGIYKEKSGITADLTGNDLSRVFLSDAKASDMSIEELYISDKQERPLSSLKQWLSGVAEVSIDGDMVDYRDQIKLVKSLYNLELVLCALILAAVLFAAGGTFITNTHAENGKKPWRIIVGIAIIALTFLGVKLVLDKLLYIPSVYLPQDNIFDFKYYYERFTGWIEWINSKGVCGSIDRYFAMKALTALAMGKAGVICFGVGVVELFLGVKKKRGI